MLPAATPPRILQQVSNEKIEMPEVAQAASDTLKKGVAERLKTASCTLDKDVQNIVNNLVIALEKTTNTVLLDCLEGCCEMMDILDHLDDPLPEGGSLKQQKQMLDGAVLGLGRLLNANGAALQNEGSLNDLLKFARALGTAAEENLSKVHPRSENYNDKIRQQEQILTSCERHSKLLEREYDAVNGSQEKMRERVFFSNALSLYSLSTRLNAQDQRFGNLAENQLTEFANKIEKIDKLLSSIDNPGTNLHKNTPARLAELKALFLPLRDALYLKHKILNDYLSPIGVQKICEAKARCVLAAQSVLKNELESEGKENDAAGIQLQKNLAARMEILENWPTENKSVNTQELLGQKKLGFFQQLLHPIRAGRQEGLLKARASLYATKDIDPKKPYAATSYFTEEMFMQAALEAVLLPLDYSKSEIRQLLHKQMSAGLDNENWKVIDSSFNVPITSAQGAQIVAKVKTQTAPAGHALTDNKTFNIISTGSPITSKTAAEFRGGTPDKPTIRGVNSHRSTETRHCTSLATSEMKIDDEVAFAATRHGVISAYDLDVAHIQALPTDERKAVMQTLSTGASNEKTQLLMGDNVANVEPEPLSALQDTPLQVEIKNELKNLGIKDDQLDAVLQDASQLADLALKSPTLCQLTKRVANLNRAREAFITELNHNKKLQAKVAINKEIHFNSISLLTPDQLRATKNKITGKKNSENERQMLIEQRQAWKDLQEEISKGGIHVNGKKVIAKIRSFNFGVNKGAVQMSSHPVLGELVSGWAYVHEQNAEGMHDLFGDPQDSNSKGEVNEHLKAKSTELRSMKQVLSVLLYTPNSNSKKIQELDKKIKTLEADIHVIEQLRDQITAMWEDETYQQAGTEPYKMVSRLALLSYLLDGGTLFNCKSGKDRTGQLDIEVKFLAFQIHTSGGTVPVPARKRTALEKAQMAVFTFEDESRRTMQEYNTGHGGSKLRGAWQLYDAFTGAFGDAVLAIREYLGGSGNAGS